MDTDNVTFRVRQRQRASSLGNLSESCLFDATSNSLPCVNLDQNESNCVRILDLENQLLIANNEIANLLSENTNIKKELEKALKIVDVYRRIDFNDVHNTPSIGRKRKCQRILMGLDESVKYVKGQPTPIIEHQKFEYERQQDTIIKLNLQIEQLQIWLEEEKGKNYDKTTDKADAESKKFNKKLNVLTRGTFKARVPLIRKYKKISRKTKRLQNKCEIANQDILHLKHKISELQSNQDMNFKDNQNDEYNMNKDDNIKQKTVENIHQNYDTLITEPLKKIASNFSDSETNVNTNRVVTSNKTLIFSDSIGQGLAARIINDVGKSTEVINYCKPGASCQKILEGYQELTKKMNKQDTVAILISKYEETYNQMTKKQIYVKLINEITNMQGRSFNIIVSGIRYNNINDYEIYNINRKIAHIANMTENVKYVDPNTGDNGKKCSYNKIKNVLIHTVVLAIKQGFQGSSTLHFIKCQKETNFLKGIPHVKKL